MEKFQENLTTSSENIHLKPFTVISCFHVDPGLSNLYLDLSASLGDQ